MTDLTPELKAQGWFNADDEFKPEPNSLYQAMKLFNDGDFVAPPIAMLWDELITNDMDDDSYFFRRLIPVTPDTIVLSREDAEYVAECGLLEGSIAQEIVDKIRQQLGGSDGN